MKVKLETIGCKVNFAETQRLKELFSDRDYSIVSKDDKADVIIINTCTVTNKAERDSRKLIRRLKRENPNAKIIATGCMVQFNPESIKNIKEIDQAYGQSEKFNIIDNLSNYHNLDETLNLSKHFKDIKHFEPAASYDPENRTRAFLKIQDGCDYFCTYCAVPYARGNGRSMIFSDVVPAIKKIRGNGFRELIISGINIGTYNSNGKSFFDLLKEIDQSKIDIRIRISSIEPNLLTDEIIDLVAKSDIFCPHFHIPLQSPDNDILKAMHRRYSIEYFANLISRINLRIPNCGIGVDVITGFPGETDEIFQNGYDYINSLNISYLHVFTYSERKNTPAATMQNKVREFDKKERTKQLRELSSAKQIKFYKSQLGRQLNVVQEHQENKNYSFGWTENYVRTKFEVERKHSNLLQVQLINLNDRGIVNSEII